MRYAIFTQQSNPAIDKPLIRKKIAYVQTLIDANQAYWLDEDRKHLGVQLRGYFIPRYQPQDTLTKAAGSGFDSAWHIKQSGFDGPYVWQLRTQRV